MALSDEWEKVHLTPNGWVSGSYKHDHGHRETVAMPGDALLTAYRRVVVGAIGARPSVVEEQTVHSKDAALIEKLLTKFGPPTFGV